MRDEDFQGILASLQETLDFVKTGKKSKGMKIHIPREYDTKIIRKNLGMSQSQFAKTFGFNLRTLQEWEQGRRVPDQSAKVLLRVIDKEPQAVINALAVA
jgi:putative transcriptional regulator